MNPIKKYILLVILVIGNLFSSAQIVVPNSDFEAINKLSDTKTTYWKISGTTDLCIIDSNVVWHGKYSMYLQKKSPDGVGVFYQEFPFKVNTLKKYSIFGAIKVKNVKEGYAGVFAKVTDINGNIICRQDMGELKINGTKEWKIYEAEFYADSNATKIKICGLLYGSGEAWFDDIAIKEIPLSQEKPSIKINNYIEEYFRIVRANTIVKDTLYIRQLKKRAELLCAGDTNMEYCYYVLKNITLNLNDNHSFFLTPDEWKDLQQGNKTIKEGWANYSSGKIINGNVAYINIPTFLSTDTSLINRYVDSLQSIIIKLDKKKPDGWIIDLSNNAGGNSWAMIAGIGPILGNGVYGYSVSANGKKLRRVYNNGNVGWDTTIILKKSNPYRVNNPKKRVAIIYGAQTASSGEVVAIAFRGMVNTKSFGTETSGATTRIDNFELSDGAYLNLASGIDADRNGVLFGNKIVPDVITKDDKTALEMAVKWVLEQK